MSLFIKYWTDAVAAIEAWSWNVNYGRHFGTQDYSVSAEVTHPLFPELDHDEAVLAEICGLPLD